GSPRWPVRKPQPRCLKPTCGPTPACARSSSRPPCAPSWRRVRLGTGRESIGLKAAMSASDPARVVEAVWRMEAARIVGALTRMLRDLGRAEELAQDALLEALERWPADGVPDRPG